VVPVRQPSMVSTASPTPYAPSSSASASSSTSNSASNSASSGASASSWNANSVPSDAPDTSKQTMDNMRRGVVHSNSSATSQRKTQEWSLAVPELSTALQLEAELIKKQEEYFALEEKLRNARDKENTKRMGRVKDSQSARLTEFLSEDEKLLSSLQRELDARQKERDYSERQRRLDLQQFEAQMVERGLLDDDGNTFVGPDGETVDAPVVSLAGSNKPLSPSNYDPNEDEDASGSQQIAKKYNNETNSEYEARYEREALVLRNSNRTAVSELPPMRYEQPADLPTVYTEGNDVTSKLDRMLHDEEEARKRGGMTMVSVNML
jgi:hypothetical protein